MVLLVETVYHIICNVDTAFSSNWSIQTIVVLCSVDVLVQTADTWFWSENLVIISSHVAVGIVTGVLIQISIVSRF